ncbi:hypothetical protein LL946_03265 [Knoellia locipacati]|uniref:hypothetical protein n=1 Tax=Knoellia locipacati TaxID=882824 RepID=UPI00384B2737
MSQHYPPPAGPGPHQGPPGQGAPNPYAGPPGQGAPNPYAGPPGQGAPNPYAGPPGQGAPNPYAGPAAYLGVPAAAPQRQGFSPVLAGFLGALAGACLTVIAVTVIPMLFFGLAMGGGFMEEDGFMGPPSGRVVVEPDGGVSGVVLADALEDGGDFYYEDVTCPDTARVATDVTTICDGGDGVENLRIVVVFEGSEGQFRTADLW